MNNYLIESIDSLSLQKEVDKLIKENSFLDSTTSIYDVEEVSLDNALEDLDTYSFLSPKKVIIIKNIDILKYDENKEVLDHLIKYIKNPNPDNLLIIEITKSGNSKTIKELKNVCNYIEVNFSIRDYIKNELKDYKLDNRVISMLEEYSLGDLTKVSNEINKLKDYKFFEKTINTDDVEELVIKKLGDSKDLTFAFSRSLALRDKKDALEKYKELINYNIEPLNIIGLLASQIRIIYQVKLLEERNLRDKEIADILGEKEFRIKKTRELTRLYSKNELLDLMRKLSDMDYRIKTDDVDGNSLVELFIINI